MAQKFVTGHNGVSYEYLGLAYLSMGMLRVSEICSLSSCLSFFSFTFYICFEGKQLGVRKSRMWNSKLCGRESDNILSLKYTAWKVSKYGVISGPCFPALGIIYSECGKIRTRNNSVFGHFSRSDYYSSFEAKPN